MGILNFLLSNWDSVIVIVIVLVAVIYLVAKKQYDILGKIILALVTEAEKQYGGGTGAVKLSAVIDWVYPKIPDVIRLFITVQQLEKLIDSVLVEAKERWAKNPNLAAYVHTQTG